MTYDQIHDVYTEDGDVIELDACADRVRVTVESVGTTEYTLTRDEAVTMARAIISFYKEA